MAAQGRSGMPPAISAFEATQRLGPGVAAPHRGAVRQGVPRIRRRELRAELPTDAFVGRLGAGHT
jgi:hypothetical protein